MKLAVTGASGFVGRQLVPLLASRGVELLLVGRRADDLARMFPGHRTCSYDTLPQHAAGFDAVLHLAVLNNNSGASEEEFFAVNVHLLLDVLAKARAAGVRRFINVSSIHALGGNDDPYSLSKRAAARLLRDQADVVTLYLPPVYGRRWGGRLAALNRLPRPLARALFAVLSALRPVVHVERIADQVLDPQAADRELVLSDGQDGNPVFRIAKRSVDLAFALGILLFFWWGLLGIWAWVRLSSRGPGIFAQRRVGKDGAAFTCLKFRTMAVGTPEVGTHDVSADAVTPLGRMLRPSRLDELPQVVNILRGEVSLVGPRPCLPSQAELIAARRRRGVLAVRPGLTGLAQVNGIDMSDPETLARWDSHYIAMRSLPLDLRIMWQTLRPARGQAASVVPGVAGARPRDGAHLGRGGTERSPRKG